MFDKAGQLRRGLIIVLGCLLRMCWVLVEGFVMVVSLERKELMTWVMPGSLLTNDWDICWDNVLNTAVLLEDFVVLQLLDAIVNLLQFDRQCLLLLTELIYLTGHTNSLSIQLNHNSPSDAVIDLAKIISIDYLLDQIIPFLNCHFHDGVIVFLVANRNTYLVGQTLQLFLYGIILKLLMIDFNNLIFCLFLLVSS